MNTRTVVLRGVVIIVVLVFSIRLFSIQVVDKQYQFAAQNNILNKTIQYPYRGMIKDRERNILVHNEPVYNIMIVPNELQFEDSTRICQLLKISQEEFIESYNKCRRYSRILPSVLYENMSNAHFASIQDELVDLPGFSVQPRTIRGYDDTSLANVLGYVGEVTLRQLRNDTSKYYRPGDFIGITGVEKTYESDLRGKRGVRFETVDVRGLVTGAFDDGVHDTLPVPGRDIEITIDLDLQKYAEKLMGNKIGSVVAIDPNTGEILAFVSSPSYDPSLFAGREFPENFSRVQSDSLKPLFNRPLQAMYPPGSMFKTIQSLIALEEGVVGPQEEIYCEGNLIGDLAPPGFYDIKRAIQLSSNNFFYLVFRRIIQQGENQNSFIDSRIGFEKWRNHITNFGLGRRLGIDLPNESSGSIPTLNTYDRIYGVNRWRFSNIFSLSIGQGELLVTPLQMANLGAILANRGQYITPHIVREVEGEDKLTFETHSAGIDSKHFDIVLDGMEQVILAGSGIRARIEDIAICGKTSTVENPHGEDHSGFMGFAPKENPQIAIAVYVENAGQGGRAAATTASLLIEKKIRGTITRPWVEQYNLRGVFTDERQSTNSAD